LYFFKLNPLTNNSTWTSYMLDKITKNLQKLGNIIRAQETKI